MADEKTPEQRAEAWQESRTDEWFDNTPLSDMAEQAFLAGRADFIKHELPKLLEMAREIEVVDSRAVVYRHYIPDLIALAEKGEI